MHDMKSNLLFHNTSKILIKIFQRQNIEIADIQLQLLQQICIIIKSYRRNELGKKTFTSYFESHNKNDFLKWESISSFSGYLNQAKKTWMLLSPNFDGFFQVKSVFIDEASQLIIKGFIKMYSIVQGCLNHRPPDFFFIKQVRKYWDFPMSVGKYQRFKFGMPNINPKGNNQIYWDMPEKKRTSFDQFGMERTKVLQIQGHNSSLQKNSTKFSGQERFISHQKKQDKLKKSNSQQNNQQIAKRYAQKRQYSQQMLFSGIYANSQESRTLSILSIKQKLQQINHKKEQIQSNTNDLRAKYNKKLQQQQIQNYVVIKQRQKYDNISIQQQETAIIIQQKQKRTNVLKQIASKQCQMLQREINEEDQIDKMIAEAKKRKNKHIIQQQVDIEQLIAKAKQEKQHKQIYSKQKKFNTSKQQKLNNLQEHDIDLLIAKAKQNQTLKKMEDQQCLKNISLTIDVKQKSITKSMSYQDQQIDLLIAKAKQQQYKRLMSKIQVQMPGQLGKSDQKHNNKKMVKQLSEQDQIELLIAKAKEEQTRKRQKNKNKSQNQDLINKLISNGKQSNYDTIQSQDDIQVLIKKAKQKQNNNLKIENKQTNLIKNICSNVTSNKQQNSKFKQDQQIQQLIAKAKQLKNRVSLYKDMEMEDNEATTKRQPLNDKTFLLRKMQKQKNQESQTNKKPYYDSILDPSLQKKYSDFPKLVFQRELQWWIKCKVIAKQPILNKDQLYKNNQRKNQKQQCIQNVNAFRCIVRDKCNELFSIVLFGFDSEQLKVQSYYNLSGGSIEKTNFQNLRGAIFFQIYFKYNGDNKVIVQKCAPFMFDQEQKLTISASYLELRKVLQVKNENLVFSAQGILKKIKIIPMKDKNSSLVIYYIVDPISQCENCLVQFTSVSLTFKNKVQQLQNQVVTFFLVYAKYNEYTKKICMYPRKFTVIKFKWAQKTDQLVQMVKWLEEGNSFDNFCSTADFKTYTSIGEMKRYSNKTNEVMLESTEIIKFNNKKQFQVCDRCMKKTMDKKCLTCKSSGIISKITVTATIADQTGKLLVMWCDQAANYLFKNRSFNKVIQNFTLKKIKIWMIKPQQIGSPYFVKRIQVKKPQQIVMYNRSLIDYLKARVKNVTI